MPPYSAGPEDVEVSLMPEMLPTRNDALPCQARTQLLEFLADLCRVFDLQPGTYFLAINLLDRYTSIRVVESNDWQLAGCTALLVAAKYLDQRCNLPAVGLLEKACKWTYPRWNFLWMEWDLLKALKWRVGHSSVYEFIQRMLTPPDKLRDPAKACLDPQLPDMALYIAEIAAFQREFICEKSSAIAECALALARVLLGADLASQTPCDKRLYDELQFLVGCPPAGLERRYPKQLTFVQERLTASRPPVRSALGKRTHWDMESNHQRGSTAASRLFTAGLTASDESHSSTARVQHKKCCISIDQRHASAEASTGSSGQCRSNLTAPVGSHIRLVGTVAEFSSLIGDTS